MTLRSQCPSLKGNITLITLKIKNLFQYVGGAPNGNKNTIKTYAKNWCDCCDGARSLNNWVISITPKCNQSQLFPWGR